MAPHPPLSAHPIKSHPIPHLPPHTHIQAELVRRQAALMGGRERLHFTPFPSPPPQAELVRRQAALMVRDLRAAVAGYSLRAAATAAAAAAGSSSSAAAASSASLPEASSRPSANFSRESGSAAAAAAAAAVSGALASAQEGALVRLQEGYRGLLSCVLVRSLVADVAVAAEEELQVPSQ